MARNDKGVLATQISNGRKTVTTGGTAEALAASATACISVIITALAANTGVVVAGGSGVVASSGTRSGAPLNAGDSISFDIDDLSKIFLDVTVNGEGVSYAYLN